MVPWLSGKSVLALIMIATVGAFGSYVFGTWRKKRIATKKHVWKSFGSEDPLTKYAMDHSLRILPIQEKLKNETLKLPMGTMMGAPEVCQLLQNLIRAMGAKKVIEIGVFTGYSTLGFAMALPRDGRVIACDINEEYIKTAKTYWKTAGVEEKIDVKIQPALKTLDELLLQGECGKIDLVFIDADKEGYDGYYEKSLQLVRKGGVIAIDNVLWHGAVLEKNPIRRWTSYITALNAKLKNDQRIDISMLVIGDGLTLAVKK